MKCESQMARADGRVDKHFRLLRFDSIASFRAAVCQALQELQEGGKTQSRS